MSDCLTPRPLGHSGVSAPPILWRADDPSAWNPSLIEICLRRGADWFILPADLTDDEIARFLRLPTQFSDDAPILLGVTSDELTPRGSPDVRRRLAIVPSCVGVILEHADPTELKAGRVFQRLSQLRDDGHIRLTVLEAQNVAAAQWIVQNSAAQAVIAPYGLVDQTAAYALLPLAAEIHTAFIATRPPQAIWPMPPETPKTLDVSFKAADERVMAQIEPLPTTVEELQRTLDALNRPMPAAEREAWWERFQEHVPPPKKPRGNHPPEDGG